MKQIHQAVQALESAMDFCGYFDFAKEAEKRQAIRFANWWQVKKNSPQVVSRVITHHS